MNIDKNLAVLAAIATSLDEFNMRREAKRMGVSFITRSKMRDGSFQPSSAVPWRILPKRTRKLFEQACKRRPT